MAADGVYVTQVEVEQRLTADLVREVYDDDADGTLETAEEPALTAAIVRVESMVEESIRKTYGEAGLVWLRATTTSAPQSIKGRILDGVRILVAERHPNYIRIDFDAAWARFEKSLGMLRSRDVELAVIGDPEPAVNEGGDVYSGDPDDTTPKDAVFMNGTGIF